ncbi:hypothetical protein RI367_006431 [Sorochytrium milnesiophthora]
MSSPAKPARTASKPPSPLLTAYLVAYNAVSLVGWSLVFVRAVNELLHRGSGAYSTMYACIGNDMRLVQTLAVLEIVHAATGIVKSPVMVTGGQVASRLLLVWGILYGFGSAKVQQNYALTTLTLAWSMTEIVRYAFYGLAQLNIRPYLLTWLRYTTFIPLYPLGVWSECTLIYQSLGAAHAVSPVLYYALCGILLMYPPGLFNLYTYMLGQRRKVLGGGGGVGGKHKRQ